MQRSAGKATVPVAFVSHYHFIMLKHIGRRTVVAATGNTKLKTKQNSKFRKKLLKSFLKKNLAKFLFLLCDTCARFAASSRSRSSMADRAKSAKGDRSGQQNSNTNAADTNTNNTNTNTNSQNDAAKNKATPENKQQKNAAKKTDKQELNDDNPDFRPFTQETYDVSVGFSLSSFCSLLFPTVRIVLLSFCCFLRSDCLRRQALLFGKFAAKQSFCTFSELKATKTRNFAKL